MAACQRCATFSTLGGLSKTQASKQGLVVRGDHHTEADCIRELAYQISQLQREFDHSGDIEPNDLPF